MVNVRSLTVAVAIGAVAALAGCQHRTISVTSEPGGALAYLNDIEVGRTPVDVEFTWFGTYAVRLELDGYRTLETSAEAEAPLHEQPGFDLLFMVLPGEERTEIAWHFVLSPEVRDEAALLQRAAELRDVFEADPSADPIETSASDEQ